MRTCRITAATRPAPSSTSRIAVRRKKPRTSRSTWERSSAAMNTTGVLRPGRVRVMATTRSGSLAGPMES